DNSGLNAAFGYVVDDQQQTLPAGQAQQLTGIYPPVVRFDDGSGQTKTRRLDGTAYRVALAADNTLDIYAADAIPPAGAASPSPASPPVVSSAAPLNNSAAPGAPAPPAVANNAVPPAASAGPQNAPPPTAAVAGPAGGASLPPGFRLFDPVAALTKPEV